MFVKKSKYFKNSNNYCSTSCMHKHQSIIRKGSGSKLYIERVKTKCGYCSKEMLVEKNRYNTHKECYCSIECMGKRKSQIYRGENNPKWDKNKTMEERINGRKIEGYKEFIKSVYKRDNYKCVICGTDGNGKNLNAHHLDGYNWCKEKRTDIDNGVTLCETCHKKFHKIYGKGNNTKEQFEEFKNNL